jgi:hypothetical protein
MTSETCSLRPLALNFEGLKRHSQVLMFIKEDLNDNARRSRAWLLHAVHKASRHYMAARQLVLAQMHASRTPDGGVLFPMWDFCLEIEDCVATAAKAVKCADKLARGKSGRMPGALELTPEGDSIVKLRNKLEHLHEEVGGGQLGSGPIVIMLDGEHLRLRDKRVPVENLTKLLEDLFVVVAALFPHFDLASPTEPPGITKMVMTMSMEVQEVPAPEADASSSRPRPWAEREGE